MTTTDTESREFAELELGLPKGRIQASVFELLAAAGLPIQQTARDYRPRLRWPGCAVKILKPQNIVEMLHSGSRDLGFAGADWVSELDADVVELLDTRMDPVRIVAAAPPEVLQDGKPTTAREIVIASEYVELTKRWISEQNLNAKFVKTFGATEVFPPEDADCIVDNTATGATLKANGLVIFDELMTSTTRLYASPRAMSDPARRARIEDFTILIKGALDARTRVMIEMNVGEQSLAAVVEKIPAMRTPTVAPLHGGNGFAVRAAVERSSLALLIPELRSAGASDIIVTNLTQVVP